VVDYSPLNLMLEPRTVTEDLHPDFALEALEGTEPTQAAELLEVVHRLPEALVKDSASAALRARLLQETSRAPERYSPFGRALSELFDLPRDSVRELLARTAEPGEWKWSGLPGIRKLDVQAGPKSAAAQTYLVKFSAGVRFPTHRHDGAETVLVLAGSYMEDGGRRFDTGDIHRMESGSEHGFTIDAGEDCVAASVLHGRLNFKSWPLRLLARAFGH